MSNTFEEKEFKPIKGVKLKTKAQEIAAQNKKEQEEYSKKFSEAADKIQEYKSELSGKIVEALRKMLLVIKDKTLPSNKGKVAEEYESSIRKEIIDLEIEINNDPNDENIAMGSVVVDTIILKALLVQRDRINELEYKLEQLSKRIDIQEGKWIMKMLKIIFLY